MEEHASGPVAEQMRTLERALPVLGMDKAPGALRVGTWMFHFGLAADWAARRTFLLAVVLYSILGDTRHLLGFGFAMSEHVARVSLNVAAVVGTIQGFRLFNWAAPGRSYQYRYGLTRATVGAVVACAEFRAARTKDQPAKLRAIDERLRYVEREVLRAHRRRGTVRWSSFRHRGLAEHARLVVAALRRAAAGLDSDPESAVRKLAVLLVSIGVNHTEGRTGALLPKKYLKGLTPARDASAVIGILRLVVGAAVVGAVLWAGVRFKWPIPAGLVVLVLFPLLFGGESAAGIPAAVLSKLPLTDGGAPGR
ncbi:hypothetical protein DN069_22270 [Streptacidiphilus pinicola]|uniref:Uncharacterized protein n=1 Tax=Streptacidiphilus pinicola TaxID=2219663 RepID=A0A2X0J7J6_9ACTN|nr:hypothetical protein [Streptacidiphilus pinicola]RAG83438.1 hypothetical protein DN069_22270 [Streptacidiphilus pinicola]